MYDAYVTNKTIRVNLDSETAFHRVGNFVLGTMGKS